MFFALYASRNVALVRCQPEDDRGLGLNERNKFVREWWTFLFIYFLVNFMPSLSQKHLYLRQAPIPTPSLLRNSSIPIRSSFTRIDRMPIHQTPLTPSTIPHILILILQRKILNTLIRRSTIIFILLIIFHCYSTTFPRNHALQPLGVVYCIFVIDDTL